MSYSLPSDAVAGSVSFSQYLDITKDVVVSFDYACFGPNPVGNEGFCVFFGDTYNPIIYGGGPGPGLAYSTVYGIDTTAIPFNPPDLHGVTCGILGIGFDLTGNFGNNTYFSSGYSDIVQNSIVLRSTYLSDYNIITRTSNLNSQTFDKPVSLYQQITGTESPVYKRVRIRLTDFCQRVVVDIKSVGDLNFTNYLDYNFTTYNNSLLSSTVITQYGVSLSSAQLTFTPSIRCGLGFSTGLDIGTVFKIRNFNINGVFTLSAAQATYTYDIDTATLSATFTDPSNPIFYTGDAMDVVNNTGGDPLLEASLIGAPYTSGDNYVVIQQHS